MDIFSGKIYKIGEKKYKIPIDYLENFVDYVSDDEIEINDEYFKLFLELDKIEQIYIESFWADKWYSEIKKFTIKSKLVYLSKTDAENILNSSENSEKLKKKYFVRLNALSPKDYKMCITDNYQDIYDIFRNSGRTSQILKDYISGNLIGDLYLFLREIDKNILDNECAEFRCFYSGKLRAISQNSPEIIDKKYHTEIKKDIITFFNQKSLIIPYFECSLDIYYHPKNKKIKIIEINSYWNASSGLFCWKEDNYQLHFSSNVEVRFLTECI